MHAALPVAEEELAFPANAVPFRDIARSEDVARQRRQIPTVFARKWHAHETSLDFAAVAVLDLDVQVEDGLLVQQSPFAGGVEANRLAVVVEDELSIPSGAVRCEDDRVGAGGDPAGASIDRDSGIIEVAGACACRGLPAGAIGIG